MLRICKLFLERCCATQIYIVVKHTQRFRTTSWNTLHIAWQACLLALEKIGRLTYNYVRHEELCHLHALTISRFRQCVHDTMIAVCFKEETADAHIGDPLDDDETHKQLGELCQAAYSMHHKFHECAQIVLIIFSSKTATSKTPGGPRPPVYILECRMVVLWSCSQPYSMRCFNPQSPMMIITLQCSRESCL